MTGTDPGGVKVLKAGTSPVPWRLLDTGAATGSFNMALDEALFTRALAGQSPPTIRFYAWSPPAVSLGYFQKAEGEVDWERCREAGVDLVRRPTGGRAVLHDDEVTYSVVWGGPQGEGARDEGKEPAGFGEGVLPIYLRVSSGLAAGLEELGLRVTLAPPLRRGWGGAPSHNPVCFSSASGYEVTCEGHKIVGSALKRHRGGFLQHGSILLGGHGDRLAGLLGERYRGRGSEGAAQVGVRDLTGGRAGYPEVVAAMAKGFARAWEVELAPASPEGEELLLARELERTKYSTSAWNRGRT